MTEQRNVSRTLPLAPLSPAERMRRVRQRQLNGLRCVTIELRKSEITALIRRGYLRSDQSADNEAIKTALYWLGSESNMGDGNSTSFTFPDGRRSPRPTIAAVSVSTRVTRAVCSFHRLLNAIPRGCIQSRSRKCARRSK